MKAVVPLAGKGTRLRPHTHATPKALIRVAGKPVLDYVLDDAIGAGVEEVVFVVGHGGDRIREHVARRHPDLQARYAVQEIQNGTAAAVALAAPWIDEEALVVFADTLFEVDFSVVGERDARTAGVIWAKEVEDYQRYGVVVTDGNGAMTRIVEKPSEPISRLANIGLYYVRDPDALFRGIESAMAAGPSSTGEHHLTDAFQWMVDQGLRIEVAPVEAWHDAGEPAALLEANRHQLAGARGGVRRGARVGESKVAPTARIEEGAVVARSRIGENVTVETGATVEDSDLEDVVVGASATVRRSRLRRSLVGARAAVEAFVGALSVAADSRVLGSGRRAEDG